MGFSSGFYSYPKYKDISFDQLTNVESVLDYETNEWCKNNYKSVEEYGKRKNINFSMPSTDVLDFYRRNMTKTEYGSYYIWNELCHFCSNGSDLHDWITKKFNYDGDGDLVLSFNDVFDIMEHCYSVISIALPESCKLNYAFRYKYTDDEYYENPELILIPCDGIEVEFDEDNTIKRIDGGEDCDFMITRNHIDPWTFNAYKICMQTCINILKTVDFSNTFITYSGGY